MNERLEEFFRYADGNGYQRINNYNREIRKPEKLKSLIEVQQYERIAADEIERLTEIIEVLKLYRVELYNRFQEINAANYHLRLTIERYRRYFENRVFYNITLERIPDRTDVVPFVVLTECHEGRDRHKAIKRFAELRKEYPQAEIIKKIEKLKWEK